VKNDAVNIEKIRIYIFGSGLYKTQPRDIDLLVVYDTQKISVQEVLALRNELSKEVFFKFGVSAHICLLSAKEGEYQIFIAQEKAQKIFPTMPNNCIHQTARSVAALMRQFMVGRW